MVSRKPLESKLGDQLTCRSSQSLRRQSPVINLLEVPDDDEVEVVVEEEVVDFYEEIISGVSGR